MSAKSRGNTFFGQLVVSRIGSVDKGKIWAEKSYSQPRLSKNLAEDVRDRAAGGVCGGHEEIRAQWGWRADERAWRADISAQFWSNVCINFGIVFILVFVWAWVPIKWHWHNHSQKRQKSLTFLTSDCRETPVLPEQNWGFYVNNWKWAIQNKSNTKDNAPSISVWVNPKFCVKSILGANRAKLICGGSRLVRLPPW